MDYVFVESDSLGRPLSPTLYVETWDMPLPAPVLVARVVEKADLSVVEVKIEKDANFEPGRTVFDFSDPLIPIQSVDIREARTALVRIGSGDPRGKVLSFEVNSLFYHHAGSTVVST
jgi:hypothetical protein